MTQIFSATHPANDWSRALLRNCCLLDEIDYAAEKMQAVLRRLPANTLSNENQGRTGA